MDELWRLWNEMCEKEGGTMYGIVRNWSTGESMSLQAYHNVLREVVVEKNILAAECTSELTSYSLRRVQATGADIWGAPWSLTVALGWKSAGLRESSKADGPSEGDSLMPLTYAGRRDDSEEFGKVMLVRILREAFYEGLRRDSSMLLLWPEVRAYAQQKNKLKAIATRLAIDMKGESWDVAYGAEDEVSAARRRRFVIPARKEQKGAASSMDVVPIEGIGSEANPIEADMSSQDEESSAESIDEHDMPVEFLTPARPKAQMHFQVDGMPQVPMCQQEVGKPFKQPIVEGVGIMNALSFGKPLCEKCFEKLLPRTRAFITKVRKE